MKTIVFVQSKLEKFSSRANLAPQTKFSGGIDLSVAV
jgi:hypothetical protein